MSWASTADVLEVTGVTVTEAQLALAAATIEPHSGRPYTATVAAVTGAKDTHWLKRAECFQAVWQLAQPDLLQRMNVKEVVTEQGTTELNDDALTLAPLAKRALSRLSWRRSRSVMARPARAGVVDLDDAGDWRPLRVRF